ncbi:PEP-CTERM sorting domain-containing protein [Piscinibacter sp. XHJ-5]|uniref:PEP-CTERM sorting domain-containing protein n=1 Tax=Piscinibacter sp. XHJ-5 TaxID=3037797 RepID=UPI002452C62B|nr:PEP-CTERM sorting domain-containing protein [Piscinibacter sp. XHJ-5]
MHACKSCTLAVAALATSLLTASPAALADVTQIINSGPLIKTELFRSDGASNLIWEELSFSFVVQENATGDGVFNLFAGGDLNNIGIDWIDVTEGPFGDRTLLGTFAFPISEVHFTACENPPHSNPAGCPLPETVPGGMFYDPSRGPPVGDVQGRRDVTMSSPGTPGLIVPQEMLVEGAHLLISLFPRNEIYDLYIDRMELSYPTAAAPIPEPSTWALLVLGLTAMAGRAVQRRRDHQRSNSTAATAKAASGHRL